MNLKKELNPKRVTRAGMEEAPEHFQKASCTRGESGGGEEWRAVKEFPFDNDWNEGYGYDIFAISKATPSHERWWALQLWQRPISTLRVIPVRRFLPYESENEAQSEYKQYRKMVFDYDKSIKGKLPEYCVTCESSQDWHQSFDKEGEAWIGVCYACDEVVLSEYVVCGCCGADDIDREAIEPHCRSCSTIADFVSLEDRVFQDSSQDDDLGDDVGYGDLDGGGGISEGAEDVEPVDDSELRKAPKRKIGDRYRVSYGGKENKKFVDKYWRRKAEDKDEFENTLDSICADASGLDFIDEGVCREAKSWREVIRTMTQDREHELMTLAIDETFSSDATGDDFPDTVDEIFVRRETENLKKEGNPDEMSYIIGNHDQRHAIEALACIMIALRDGESGCFSNHQLMRLHQFLSGNRGWSVTPVLLMIELLRLWHRWLEFDEWCWVDDIP